MTLHLLRSIDRQIRYFSNIYFANKSLGKQSMLIHTLHTSLKHKIFVSSSQSRYFSNIYFATQILRKQPMLICTLHTALKHKIFVSLSKRRYFSNINFVKNRLEKMVVQKTNTLIQHKIFVSSREKQRRYFSSAPLANMSTSKRYTYNLNSNDIDPYKNTDTVGLLRDKIAVDEKFSKIKETRMFDPVEFEKFLGDWSIDNCGCEPINKTGPFRWYSEDESLSPDIPQDFRWCDRHELLDILNHGYLSWFKSFARSEKGQINAQASLEESILKGIHKLGDKIEANEKFLLKNLQEKHEYVGLQRLEKSLEYDKSCVKALEQLLSKVQEINTYTEYKYASNWRSEINQSVSRFFCDFTIDFLKEQELEILQKLNAVCDQRIAIGPLSQEEQIVVDFFSHMTGLEYIVYQHRLKAFEEGLSLFPEDSVPFLTEPESSFMTYICDFLNSITSYLF